MATEKRSSRPIIAPKHEQLLHEVEERIAEGRRKYDETKAQIERARRLLEETDKLAPDKLKPKDQ